MTTAQLETLRALLAKGMFFPEARELALLMIQQHERRTTQ